MTAAAPSNEDAKGNAVTEQGRRPNIVLIMSDQHNARVMGCAGDDIVRTPNLDALAERGVRFSNMYCPYPLCLPSRMGFMAGRHPSEIDCWDNGSFLASDLPTFAHCFGASGYEAVLCGRMHFAGPDQFHGFEKRLLGDVWQSVLRKILGEGENRTNGQTRYAVDVSGYGKTGYEAYDEEIARRTREFLTERKDDRPFCLVAGMILPHNPLICSRDLFEYYMDALGPAEGAPEGYLAHLHPALVKWRERRGVDGITPERARRGRAAYYGLVTTLDRNIGLIMDAIENSPYADNTLTVYTSDHGDMAGEQGMWWKSSFYDGSALVPCIASWPGRYPGGDEVEAVASLVDIGPTILDIAEAEPIPDATGRSLRGFLGGNPPAEWPDEAFSEYLGLKGDGPSCMVRSGRWKLNYYAEFDSYQLFNMRDDPLELTDLRDDPSHRGVAERLLARIRGRWSAERMLEASAREKRARGPINRCGHTALPHAIPRFHPPADANRFDVSQLPSDG